jgi:CRISPR-associated protein (TIGR03984 family)
MNGKHWKDVTTEITIDEAFEKDPRGWLAYQGVQHKLSRLLAHADDGVIWGRLVDDGTLKLSGDVFSEPQTYSAVAVPLRIETLQQVRLFGTLGELFIWKTQSGFKGRLIKDDSDDTEDTYEETHLLWGTCPRETREGFTLLVEGQRGLRHAPPLEPPSNGHRVVLKVRHYIDFDEEDQAYVAMSRLVNLTNEIGGKNGTGTQ